MNKFQIGLSLLAYILIASCQENASKQMEASPKTKTQQVEKQKVAAPISSPEKMFGYIHKEGVAYSKELMNSTENSTTYVQPPTKALNFGIYTTDLAYAAAYQDLESTIELYKTVKRMSAELNIAEMMTSEMVERMQANMENPDSLAVVAGKAYYQAVEFLDANSQNGKLALMSVGGWIESLYITMSAVEENEAGALTVQKIADQKKIVQNLYAYLKNHENELGVEEAIKQLKPIAAIYENILLNENSEQLEISDEQYEQLKTAIVNYRNRIVSIN
tara:strand:- start:1352 stop:2179 length:828 start_codon:yes stop_codon:yes gene_type:complete